MLNEDIQRYNYVFVSETYGAVDKALLPEVVCADEMKAIKERLAQVEEEQELEKERNFRLNHGPGRRSYKGDAVAFFATIGASVEHLEQGQTVVFDQLLTMLDSAHSVVAYSATTGVFTAPLNGLYVFFVTLLALN
ncbi:uncharacterized protein LOC127836073 [Dreissena polymorpha]|uniref:uncharacterized protein LOC127836073 n=1 Tax=Dreissena polymorpha TaxID=45954 RepID=UPI002263BB6E|nr:uncharacterized protein LOC127836073 [Dreissena polymorpha]